MRPKRAIASSTTLAIASRSRTSASKANTDPPFASRSAASFFSCSPSTSTINTWAPSSAKSRDTPAPIPAAAPVTTTVLFLINCISLLQVTVGIQPLVKFPESLHEARSKGVEKSIDQHRQFFRKVGWVVEKNLVMLRLVAGLHRRNIQRLDARDGSFELLL